MLANDTDESEDLVSDRSYSDPRGPADISHELSRIGAYHFSNDGTSGRPINREAISLEWPIDDYPAFALKHLSKEVQKEVSGWPRQVQEWKEKHGDELKNW